jgi:hypothetical protein
MRHYNRDVEKAINAILGEIEGALSAIRHLGSGRGHFVTVQYGENACHQFILIPVRRCAAREHGSHADEQRGALGEHCDGLEPSACATAVTSIVAVDATLSAVR